jgi:hypothetical protein
MSALLAILRELVAIFIDDGSIAVALVLWSALAWYLLPALPINAGWDGPILLLGYLLILGENLARTARKRR